MTYLPAEGCAWQLSLRPRTRQLVYATFSGDVHCLDLDSRETLWTLEGEDFPFALETVGLADGRDLALLATAGGDLVAIDQEGVAEWKLHSSRPMYTVAAGRFRSADEVLIACGGIERKLHLLDAAGHTLSARQARRYVHRLLAGDFDGDGLDELLMMDGLGGAVMLKLSGDRFEVLWEHPIQLPDEYANWENWSGQHQPMDLHAADIDGDGRDEIVMGDSFHNHQTVAVVSGDGEFRWASKPLSWYATDRTWFEYFSTAWVTAVPAETEGEPLEIVTVSGGQIRIFSADGRQLAEAESTLGFSNVVSNGRTLYLGSVPSGDDTLYRLELSTGWQERLTALEPRGKFARIRRTLAEIRNHALRKPDARPASPYLVQQFRLDRDGDMGRSYRRDVEIFSQQVPEPGIVNVAATAVLEPEPIRKADGTPFNRIRFDIDSPKGTSTPDEIVQLVRDIEAQRIPTVIQVGHNCNPKVTLETAERMLQAGREYLVGFGTAEDVSAETIGDYVEEFIGPLCDLCLQYGRKTVAIKNKVLWWLDAPAMKRLYDQLFATERREVIIAATEESNARWSETNLMGRLGLYYAGLVGGIKAGVIRDMFEPNRFYECEYPRSGHPFLRLLVAHTVVGASSYRLAISDRVTSGPDKGRYNLLGRESTELLLHLLGKGIVFPPRPDQMANICTVGLVMHPPPEKWLRNAHKNHHPWEAREDDETLNAVYPRLHCGWGHAPLPEHAFVRVALDKRRVADGMVPATPYGHVLMLPCHCDYDRLGAVKQWWHTDGIYLWREGGQRLLGPAAGDALRDSLQAASGSLALRSVGENVFYQLIRKDAGGYRLFAIDPGWLDPADRVAAFEVNLPGSLKARDVLSDQVVPIDSDRLELVVPAGAFRVVDLDED